MDSNWPLAVPVPADTCVTLGGAAAVAVLESLLEPWPVGRPCSTATAAAAPTGAPVDHHLGRHAATRGDHEWACDLLTRAVGLCEEFRAQQFAARSRAAPAGLATRPD